jgi:signal transduction histidine kinase/DNA-binding response OmpR family regulator/iron only hydrogenase large subunit-like protein
MEGSALIEVIKTKNELCTGCNRCVRECPMEFTNITYQDDQNNIKVRIDTSRCISCGRCVSACKHEARYYEDDTARFFTDLKNGAPISIIAAPSIQTNIPNWKRLFTYLKNAGVKQIYDVSYGADICIWAHIKYIGLNPGKPLITQPCPAIVSYIKSFKHELIKHLSPVHSPMACLSMYMREYEGITDSVAALSPCVAKADEFADTGLAQYNITFSRLLEYLKENGIELPDEETGFDGGRSGLGSIFPMPGGLKENIEYFLGKKLRISKAEGFGVYDELDAHAETPDEFLPELFDVLNCGKGCNIGPANVTDGSIFKVDKIMDESKRKATENEGAKRLRELFGEFDAKLDFDHFLREYSPVHLEIPNITDADIAKAFEALGKSDYDKQHVDCGACGSDTCYKMARKIALGVNIPTNCIVKSMHDAKEEHEQNIAAHEHIAQIEKIHEADERMKAMLNANPLSAYFWDSDINVFDCNEESVKLHKLSSKKEFIERFYELSPEYQPDGKLSSEKAYEMVKKAFDEGYHRFEWMHKTLDGGEMPVEATLIRIDYEGESIVAGYSRDLREEKSIRKNLEAAVRKASDASLAKSNFLANMSHEIRTPMNAIIGMTNIAKSTDNLERIKYAVDKIEISANHLLGVINDILDMSKIEAGKFELSPTEFSFENMLKRVVTVSTFRVSERKQILAVDIDKDIPDFLIGDEQRLAQIVTNLLGNAVKFTPERGSIDISAKLLDADENGLCTIQIDVKDTGIGLSEEQQAKLFKSFSQAESDTARKFGGTGLGLAISKNIVEMMDGKIWVKSKPSKGSAFSFTVKMKDAEKCGKKAHDWKTIRALVVDDNKAALDTVKIILNRFGAVCDTAFSSNEALDLVEKNGAYNIYFIDFLMPGINGIELTKILRKKNHEDSHIVMISGEERLLIEDEAIEAGINRFIAKPLFPSDIADAVNECLGVEFAKEQQSNIDCTFEGHRILLAEDVDINREIVLAMLEPTMLEIDCAENGKEAVRMFNEAPDRYDMIFMDIQMPEMDGYEAARQIRAFGLPNAQTIPIVAMTANVFKEDVERCLEAGMNAHVGKPLDFDEVISILKKYLNT